MRTFVITVDGIARIMRTYGTDATGHISPTAPAPDAADEVKKWLPERQAKVSSIREISEADIPAEFTLRDAWRDDGSKITWDMPAARAKKTDLVRKERNKRLAESDAEVARLDGGNVPPGLKKKRQDLRDLPATIQPDLDAITDPAALASYEPTWPT